MFSRSKKPKAPAPVGNPDTAAIMRELKAAGITEPTSGHGNVKDEVRQMIRAAMQLEQNAQKARAARDEALATTLSRRAAAVRERAQSIIRLHSR